MLPLITIIVMILFTKRMLAAKYTDNNDTHSIPEELPQQEDGLD